MYLKIKYIILHMDNCNFQEINDINNEKSFMTRYENKIELWTEICRRKKNTYISGWDICIDELKNHLKYIKKKTACNGTIKKLNSNNDDKYIILLQGDHINFIVNYLYEQNINKDNIYIKG